jgi:hypothetical protein
VSSDFILLVGICEIRNNTFEIALPEVAENAACPNNSVRSEVVKFTRDFGNSVVGGFAYITAEDPIFG